MQFNGFGIRYHYSFFKLEWSISKKSLTFSSFLHICFALITFTEPHNILHYPTIPPYGSIAPNSGIIEQHFSSLLPPNSLQSIIVSYLSDLTWPHDIGSFVSGSFHLADLVLKKWKDGRHAREIGKSYFFHNSVSNALLWRKTCDFVWLYFAEALRVGNCLYPPPSAPVTLDTVGFSFLSCFLSW